MTTDPAPQHHELTYGQYLKIDELLALQQCLSRDPDTGEPEHDETLFIVIHQVYELWFKQVLHELDALAFDLDEDAPYRGGHRLSRVLKILKTLVAQLDVLETMTPLEFSSFRSFLANSSGFQSAQFREVEFLLGQKTTDHLDRFEPHPEEFARLTRRYNEPTVWDHLVRYLDRRGFDMPPDVIERDVTQPVVESSGVQTALVDVYRNDPELSAMCEAFTDLDEGVQEWRYRHVMMVQRTIGAKVGTGGSLGAAYLRQTLFRPVFPDLWAVRSQF
jgi:tryptophan 2,3-dioxygenase